MKRRLFTLASALSFVLCTATLVLWVRSYLACDEVGIERQQLKSMCWTRDTV